MEGVGTMIMFWQPLKTASQNKWVLLGTSAGWSGEAQMYYDCDGTQRWIWATGEPVHVNHKLLAWMLLPLPPEDVV